MILFFILLPMEVFFLKKEYITFNKESPIVFNALQHIKQRTVIYSKKSLTGNDTFKLIRKHNEILFQNKEDRDVFFQYENKQVTKSRVSVILQKMPALFLML